jgi:hypothetical protein
MLIRRIETMFPVMCYEVFQYRDNKFALYASGHLRAVRSELREIEIILNEVIR